MVRTIVLHGALRDEFGESFKLDIASPTEAIRALCIMVKGFRAHLREGYYAIVRGKVEEGEAIKENALTLRLGGARELHIIPVVVGGRWWVSAIIGATLIAASFFIAGPLGSIGVSATIAANIAKVAFAVGVSLTLSGVSQLLAPSVKTQDSDATQDQKQSFLFGGQVNRTGQGGPVPLIYGTTRVGTVIVSAGIVTEELGVAGAFVPPDSA